MNRNTFKTKNQLQIQRYLTIILTMLGLMIVFLSISNYGQKILMSKLSAPSITEDALNQFSSLTAEERARIGSEPKLTMEGDRTPTVCIYDTVMDNTAITAQLDIAKQAYHYASTLSEVEDDVRLLIIRTDSLSSEDVSVLQKLVENQVAVLFAGLPDAESLRNVYLRRMLGIQTIVGETDWPGVRVSGELLLGEMLEDPEYEISGMEVILYKNNKIYACALPEDYISTPNMELPPIIWRHMDVDTGGRVYVYNSTFSEKEMGYGLISVILSEINDNYIYPIINAYCVTVSGYPYSDNESRDIWTKLYSRDKMQIQQDLLSSQIHKYAKTYSAVLTCFSPNYEVFRDTDDKELAFYTDEIEATRSLLAKEEDGKLYLDDETRGVEIETWSDTFTFTDSKTGNLKLPVCFTSTVDNVTASLFGIAGMACTTGYYFLELDYNDVLEYSEPNDFWTEYCETQEVMLSTQNRDYGWIERVTVKEAFGRLLQLQNMEIDVQYLDDRIVMNLDSFNTKAWFLLRSSKSGLSIDNGTIEQLGNNCYFVTITDQEAVITWEEE